MVPQREKYEICTTEGLAAEGQWSHARIGPVLVPGLA